MVAKRGSEPATASATPPINGIHALIQAKTPEQRRLPLLEVICDRMAPAVAASMRHLSTEAVEISLERFSVDRFGEIMSRVALPSVFGVFQIATLGGPGVLALESGVVHTLIEALMGGDAGEGARLKPENRGFTSLETSLMGEFMKLVLREFDRAFDEVSPITTRLERSEALPRFAAVAEPTISTVQCVFRIDRDGKARRFHLILPITTLEPVRDKLSQRLAGGSVRSDSAWADYFEREIRRTPIRLDAVLAQWSMSLQDLLGLEVGQLISLDRPPQAPVTLHLGGLPAGRADMGKRTNRHCVRLVEGLRAGL